LKVGTNGFFFIDKPAGPSSFAVVSAVRRSFRVQRAGHGGTLDPAASGLLIVALGSATRLLPYVPLEPKRYAFTIRFGAETDTLDAAGVAVKSGGRVPSRSELLDALPMFTGAILQVPPDYSAIKIDGVRAYHTARLGRAPKLAPRSVTVNAINLDAFDEAAGVAELSVTCSGGTYVRSLARDIAHALGTYGHAGSIRRTALGPFHVDAAMQLGECTPSRVAPVPCGEVLRGMPRIVVGEFQKRRLLVGGNLPFADLPGLTELPTGPTLALDEGNAVIAVLEPGAPGHFHPTRVFPDDPADSPEARP
jgi:tRNA pseudouridine55 synthase